MGQNRRQISDFVKSSAIELGFAACGIARAGLLEKESVWLKKWLSEGKHAGMEYMNRNVEKRLNPRALESWSKSVIVCLYNYFPGESYTLSSQYKISKYAYGQDYHRVLKDKLHLLKKRIEKLEPSMQARVFVDSAPVMERAWAVHAGLGWTGKNSCLINKKGGSFYFIGVIITDLDLDYDQSQDMNLCGTCTRCIEACPNQAIISPGLVDSRKCISYLTIEHKGEFTDKKTQLHGWIFGCDICQDVCPWNRFAKPHQENAFIPKLKMVNMTDEMWEQLSEREFIELFKGTAVERTGYKALKRNLQNNDLLHRD
jgi:epoxyqueuosine reductase